MVKVYFESSNHAELVALFKDEETYLACAEALDKEAEKHRMFVTTSISEEDSYLENLFS
jgi:hypothetical protein